MITDINCWYGDWPFSHVKEEIGKTLACLRKYGADRIYISPLGAVLCRNQQSYNDELLEKTKTLTGVFPVPVIAPSLPTWEDEFRRMRENPGVRMIRVLPGYVPCPAESLKLLCIACADADLPLLVQCRMEDTRTRHPLMTEASEMGLEDLLELKRGLPSLNMIAAGLTVSAVASNAKSILSCRGIYIDTSMLDGMDAIETLIGYGLKQRLLFGSHAPMLETYSAVAKIAWVADADAEMIFHANAASIGL